MRRKYTREQLDQHQRAVDRLIFLAVKRRECERELRDLGQQAQRIAIWDSDDAEAIVKAADIVAQDFVFGKTVPHRG